MRRCYGRRLAAAALIPPWKTLKNMGEYEEEYKDQCEDEYEDKYVDEYEDEYEDECENKYERMKMTLVPP